MDNYLIDYIDNPTIKYILNNLNSSFICSWSTDQFIQAMNCKSAITFVIKNQDGTLGFLCVNKLMDGYDILNICIHSNYRHIGLGTKLIEYLKKYAKDKKLYNITLEVNVNNNNAIALYEKLGFKIIGMRKNYYYNNITNELENAHIMNIKGD